MSASEAVTTAPTPSAGTTSEAKTTASTDQSPQPPSTREVGNQATWSLSSCKPGSGVEQIRDDNYESYWQSDGQLPHLVNIQFKRKTTVSAVAIYTDFRHDESYTPSKVSIRCGTNFNDLGHKKNAKLLEAEEALLNKKRSSKTQKKYKERQTEAKVRLNQFE